jgi:glycosyltransferase EpsD
MKKTIVHILNTLCIGGIENIVINLCNTLTSKKYNVYLIILAKDNMVQIDKINKNVQIVILPFFEKEITGVSSYHFFFKGIPYLANILKKIKPDIIHTHMSLHRLWMVSLAVRKSNVNCKNFHTIHLSGLYYVPDNLYKRIQLYVEKQALKIRKPYLIAVSSAVEEKCRKLLIGCYREIRYIPNGIDILNFKKNTDLAARNVWGINRNDIVLVYVARLCEGKGHLTLLQAIELVKDKIPNIRICLIGDGELMTQLKDYSSHKQLDEYVLFIGATDKVADILSVSDIGIFPSEHEGFSISLLEMMATGIPIICTDIPVFKTIFSDSHSALFFNTGNYELLSIQIEKICRSKDIQSRLGKAAKNIAQYYSLQETVKKHESYYNI